ncbi:delta-endotoxin CytB [Marasmius fiardii PR-910]|nr:delta-endotoxin CytB [Marasmius fiardii PR-910]
MANDQPLYFDQLSTLPEDLAPTSLQVAKFVSHYVDLNEPKAFNWSGFFEGLRDYGGEDLRPERPSNERTNQQGQTLRDAVNTIVEYLSTVTPIDITSLTNTVGTTFTNLEAAKKNNWADFSKTPTPSWQYRLHLAFPKPDSPDEFNVLVAMIELGADVTDETWWYNLTMDTNLGNFNTGTSGMKLIVKKGFMDPLNG